MERSLKLSRKSKCTEFVLREDTGIWHLLARILTKPSFQIVQGAGSTEYQESDNFEVLG